MRREKTRRLRYQTSGLDKHLGVFERNENLFFRKISGFSASHERFAENFSVFLKILYGLKVAQLNCASNGKNRFPADALWCRENSKNFQDITYLTPKTGETWDLLRFNRVLVFGDVVGIDETRRMRYHTFTGNTGKLGFG